jgi:putative spermidine/putrescine transport system substrate-binding protein
MNHACKTTTVAGVAALGILAAPTAAVSAESLTIVSWGGAYEESQRKAYYEPYIEMTGTEIVQVSKSANGLAGVRAQVEAGNVTWDLVDMLEGPAIRACDEGIIEPIDHNDVLKPAPNGASPDEDFIPELRECFVPQILYATLWATNTEMWDGEQPDSIADIWNTSDFGGKRAMQKIPAGNLEWALMADGVPHDGVYEVLETREGVNRAFSKLNELKGNAVWWSEGAQPPQLLADKEVSLATGYNGRFFNAQIVEDQPIEIIWDGQLFEVDGWVVPQGRLTEEVKQFLRFATDTQRLADQAKYISYGPARSSSAKLVGDHAETGVDMKPHMPTNPDNLETAIAKDAIFWADNGDSLSERFNAWLAM